MKPTRFNPYSILAATIILAPASHAATYQWNGTSGTEWTTPGNWVPASSFYGQTITGGSAPTNITTAHRLNINNGTGNAAVYTVAQGTTVYQNGTSNRGLVIGSGTPTSGTLRITGGSFSTVDSGGGDVIGNGPGNSGTLIIDGGAYLAGATVAMGIGNSTSTFTIINGSATLPTLSLNNTTGTVNLNGGTLAVNTITRTNGTNTINFAAGTLKARIASTTFLADLLNTTARVKTGGAIIGTIGVAGSGATFIENTRVDLSFSGDNKQLLADYTPGVLTWKGNAGTNPTCWDNGTTANWFNTTTSSADSFVAGDAVLFNDNEHASSAVAIQGTVMPGGVGFSNNTLEDTLSGGSIAGTGTLTVNGPGTVNLTAANSYSDGTKLDGGVVNAPVSPTLVSLTKVGTGIWALSGDNTYSGNTLALASTGQLRFVRLAVTPN